MMEKTNMGEFGERGGNVQWRNWNTTSSRFSSQNTITASSALPKTPFMYSRREVQEEFEMTAEKGLFEANGLLETKVESRIPHFVKSQKCKASHWSWIRTLDGKIHASFLAHVGETKIPRAPTTSPNSAVTHQEHKARTIDSTKKAESSEAWLHSEVDFKLSRSFAKGFHLPGEPKLEDGGRKNDDISQSLRSSLNQLDCKMQEVNYNLKRFYASYKTELASMDHRIAQLNAVLEREEEIHKRETKTFFMISPLTQLGGSVVAGILYGARLACISSRHAFYGGEDNYRSLVRNDSAYNSSHVKNQKMGANKLSCSGRDVSSQQLSMMVITGMIQLGWKCPKTIFPKGLSKSKRQHHLPLRAPQKSSLLSQCTKNVTLHGSRSRDKSTFVYPSSKLKSVYQQHALAKIKSEEQDASISDVQKQKMNEVHNSQCLDSIPASPEMSDVETIVHLHGPVIAHPEDNLIHENEISAPETSVPNNNNNINNRWNPSEIPIEAIKPDSLQRSLSHLETETVSSDVSLLSTDDSWGLFQAMLHPSLEPSSTPPNDSDSQTTALFVIDEEEEETEEPLRDIRKAPFIRTVKINPYFGCKVNDEEVGGRAEENKTGARIPYPFSNSLYGVYLWDEHQTSEHHHPMREGRRIQTEELRTKWISINDINKCD